MFPSTWKLIAVTALTLGLAGGGLTFGAVLAGFGLRGDALSGANAAHEQGAPPAPSKGGGPTPPAGSTRQAPPRANEPPASAIGYPPAAGDFYTDVYRLGRDRAGVGDVGGPPGPAGSNAARGGLFIPTPDGGWMDVGERVLSLERELRETRRQLDELKKALGK